MKTRILNAARLSLPLATAIAALLTVASSQALTYYWDNNGVTGGFGNGANGQIGVVGTWAATTTGNTTQGWSQNSGGTVTPVNVVTALADDFNFGSTTTGTGAGTLTVSGTVPANSITFAVGSNSYQGPVTLSGGTINLNAAGTITVNNVSDSITSAISGAATSFTKLGTGTLTLSGTNTYTGQTLVNAGVLLTTKPASLNGYTTAAKVVFGGGTVGARVGTGGWTTTQVDTLLTNATKTSGALGIDTTTADLTQWTPFTTTNLGSTLGLNKLGYNTLTLNSVNSYAGATTITGGTLKLLDSGTGLTQTLSGALTLAGFDDVTLESNNAGSGTLSTTFGTLSRAVGNSTNIVSTGGAPGTTNIVNLTGAVGFINKGVFFNGSSFAARNTAGGYVRALAYDGANNTVAPNTVTASKHVQLTTTATAQPTISLLSLNLNGSGVGFTQAASTILTVPAILKSGGGSVGTISGGTSMTGGTGVELVVRTDLSTDLLTIGVPITGSGALTKSGAGKLRLTADNTYTGNTYINGGTLELSGGGSLGSGNYAETVYVNKGATLLLTVSSGNIFQNGVIAGDGDVTVSATGSGGLTLGTNPANKHPLTGTLTLNSGWIRTYRNNFTSGNLTVNGGYLDDYFGSTFNRVLGSGAGQVQILGGVSGWSENGATGGVVKLNNNTLEVQWGSAFFNPSQLTLQASTAQAGSTLDFQNALDLNGATRTVNTASTTAGTSATISGVIRTSTGTAGFTKVGAGELTLSGANIYTGPTTISAGKLSAGVATVADTSGAFGINSAVSLANVATAVMDITGFSTQIGSLTGGGTTGGNVILGAATLTVGADNTSPAAYAGTITGTGALTKIGTGTLTLSGLSAAPASNYSGNTTIGQGTLKLTTTNPSLTGLLYLGSANGSSDAASLDLSTASATIAGAFQARTDSATNTVAIGTGKTLQLNGAVTVGYNSAGNSTTNLNVTGLGALAVGTSVAPTDATFRVGNGGASGFSNAGTLDMSGLSNFTAYLGTASFRIGSPTNGTGPAAAGSTVKLATDSTINALALVMGSPDGSVTQSLKLGSGVTVINVDTLNAGGTGTGDGRSSGSLTFEGATGTLKVRSQADPVNGRATLNVGNGAQNTGTGQLGHLFDTLGHSADLRLGTMTVGARTNGNAPTTGNFKFDTGTLDVDLLIAGSKSVTNAAGAATGIVTLGGGSSTFNNTTGPIQLGVSAVTLGTAAGTLNVSGGTVNVATNAGTSILLGDASVAGGTANGTVNVTGGTLTLQGDIIRGATTGTSNATINLDGGTLDMTGKNIGSANTVTFNAKSGTLQNVAQVNNGAGWTKSTANTLILAGTNTYSGDTTVSAGKLLVSGSVSNSTVALNSGTLTGSGSVNGVSAADSVNAVISNNDGVAGAPLTIGSLTFNGAATVNTFSNSPSAAIVGGPLSSNAAGTVTINPTAASWSNGSHNLISYTGGSIGGAGYAQFALGTVLGKGPRQVAVLGNSGSAITLEVSSTGDPYWTGALSDKWNTDTLGNPKNWTITGGGGITDFITGDNVLFDDNASGAGPINVDIDLANVSPATTTFSNITKDYVLGSTGSFGISTGIFTKSGAGKVTINNANTYAGGTTVNAGTLALGNASAIGTGTLTLGGGNLDSSVVDLVNAGNNVQAWDGDFTFAGTQNLNLGTGAVTMSANRAVTVSANTLSVGGAVGGGAVSLTKNGGGTLVLSAAGSYSGGLNIAAGTVTLGNAASAGTGTITFNTGGATNATLQCDRASGTTITNAVNVVTGSTGTNTLANVGSAIVTFNSAINIDTGTTLTLTNNSTGTSSLELGSSALVSGLGGVATAGSSTGNLVFRGANTYSGGTTLGGAGIIVPTLSSTGPDGSPTDGPFGTGAITIGNVSIRSTTLIGTTIGNTLTLAGNLTAVTIGSEKTLIFSGPATLTASRTITSNVGTTDPAKTLTFSGSIGESSSGYGLTKAGTGTLVLSGSASTFTGPVVVSAGTLQSNGTGTLANIGTPGSLGSGDATSNATNAASLVLDGGTYSIINTNAPVSTDRLFTLTQNGGTLSADNGTAANVVTFGNPAAIAYTGTGARTLTLGGAHAGGTNANLFAPQITNAGAEVVSLLKTGTTNWALTNTNTYSGATTINGGTLQLGDGTSGNDGTIANTSGVTNNGTLAFNRFGSSSAAYTITGTGAVTKLGAGTQTLTSLSAIAANNYSGTTIVDQGTLAFTTTAPSLTGGLTFGSAAGSTNTGTLDLSTVSTTFGGGMVVRNNSASNNVITIGSGQTLTFTGSSVANAISVGSATAGGLAKLQITGSTGTLEVNDTTRNIVVANTDTTGSNASAQMDLSGLGTFNATIANLYVGRPTSSAGAAANGRPLDVLTLAGANTINASGVIAIGGTGQSFVGSGTLKLGTTNTLNSDKFVVGSGRTNGTMQFNTGLTNPGVTIRGAAGGITPTNIYLGDAQNAQGVSNNSNGSSVIRGTLDFTGGAVDAMINDLIVGNGAVGTGGARGAGHGTFIIDGSSSNVDINTLVLARTRNDAAAQASSPSPGTSIFTLKNGTLVVNTEATLAKDIDTTNTASGTQNVVADFNIEGGTATIGSIGTPVNLIVGTHVASGNAGTATTTVDLTGGTLNMFGDIKEGTVGNGTITSSLTLDGATLDMKGNRIGLSGALIDTPTFASGTLQNVAEINDGAALTKTTSGTLTLSGTNTYTGATSVDAGTLALGANNVLPDTAVSIGTATLDAATFTDTLGTLDASGAAVINLGASGTLAFANSSAVSWTGGTLNITGTFVPGSSIRFGTDATGLDAGQLALISVNGTGTGTYVLNSSGYLVTGLSGYASWINGFFPGETLDSIIGAGADPDNDGISNGVEMVIGGDPKDGMDTALLPTIEMVNADPDNNTIFSDYLLFTYRRSDLSVTAGVTADCETDTDLVGTWTAATGAPGVVILTDDNFTFTPPAAANTDRVRVYVPRGANPTLFGRLDVQVP